MLTRHEFMVRAGLASATVATGGVGLAGSPGAAFAAKAPATGYLVGNTAPAFAGVDQYMRSWTSAQFKGWTLLDFTASWCAPCNKMQEQFVEFQQYLAGYGHTLSVVDILLQGSAQNLAGQTDAERWVARYGNERRVTLHPNGVANDPLFQLWDTYCHANFAALDPNEDIFPTSVLLDSKRVIRFVIQDWLSASDDPSGVSTAGQIARAIGPAIADPALGFASPPSGATLAYGNFGALAASDLSQLGLNATRQTKVMNLCHRAQRQMAARTFSPAADTSQSLSAKLTIWGVDPDVITANDLGTAYLRNLGSP